jgi:hypothetical protein
MIPTTIRTVLNPDCGRRRRLLKWGLLLFVLLAVAYPRPDRLVRNIVRWRNLDSLIDPDNPALAPLAAEVAPRLEGVPPGPEALRIVEDYVLRRIPYAWDWETWGVLDYVPTVEETLAVGREDCDGRAVIAASLLRRFGYDASITSDLSHVWVRTSAGETMTPVRPASGGTIIAASIGGPTRINWAIVFNTATLLKDVPTSLAYGIAVFPAWREAIVVLALFLVLADREPRFRRELVAMALIVAGWWVLRWTCGDAWNRSYAGAWTGYGLIAAGLAAMLWPPRRAASAEPALVRAD